MNETDFENEVVVLGLRCMAAIILVVTEPGNEDLLVEMIALDAGDNMASLMSKLSPKMLGTNASGAVFTIAINNAHAVIKEQYGKRF